MSKLADICKINTLNKEVDAVYKWDARIRAIENDSRFDHPLMHDLKKSMIESAKKEKEKHLQSVRRMNGIR